MDRDDLDWAVEQAAREGWNPGLHDADAFFAQDPEGFLIGELDGKPIGCVSAVRYAGGYGFIGFFIVLPEFRGHLYGAYLGRAALDRLEGGIIGIDGVFAKQENYAAQGFVAAYRNIRFEFCGSGLERKSVETVSLVETGAIPFERISEYDHRQFGFERRPFLRVWLDLPEASKIAAVNPDGTIAGYGVIRKCRSGWKVGPLFADSLRIAEKIFSRLLSVRSSSEPVYLDVPEQNAAAMFLAREWSMKEVFGTARMYKGGIPRPKVEHIFGITSFELG
jgi:GNAT superfamily N-acetyltransferase